jgi:hypothetical protein
LKKEYVVTEIVAAPDGSPYVLISLKDPRDMKERAQSPFGSQVGNFKSMDEIFRNLSRTLTTQLTSGFATVIKLALNEYEELNIKVGDRIVLDISKSEVVSV